MKQRILSLSLLICVLFSTMTPAYAGGISGILTETLESKGNITLQPVDVTEGKIVLSGVHASGRAGKRLSYQIVDDEGTVFGLGEMRTTVGGGFSVTPGLLPSAYGKTLTAQVRSIESDEISATRFTCVYDLSGSDSIIVGAINATSTISIDTVEYTDPSVTIRGVYTGGAGKTMKLKIVDAGNDSLTYIGDTTVRTNAGGAFTFVVSLPGTAYNKNLRAVLTCTADTTGLAATAEFVFSGGYQANRETIAELVADIESLIASCEAKGFSVEYEKTNLGVIKRFSGFLEDYIDKSLTAEYAHNFDAIVSLGTETIAALKGYLDGTKAEKVAPIYVSSDVTVDGQSLLATTNVKGELRQQPVFFNGYGHWADALTDYDSFTDLGINYTHYEVGPNSILSGYDESGNFIINQSGVAAVKEVFRKAEENNLSVMLLTAMHYFPDFIYEAYPEIANGYHPDDENFPYPDFIPYNPTHPEVMRAITAFLNAIIPEIKDYQSFHSISLANEPFYIVNSYPDYYLAEFRTFLQNRYGSISKLNSAYGSKFASFAVVTMPSGGSTDARYVDWRDFNDTILTKWFAELTDIVHAMDETILVHVKCSSYIASHSTGRRRNFCGTNYEQWSQIFDINGCDAWGIYGESANTLQGKTMWYDFQTSLKNAPIINSEDHILRDNAEITYRPNELLMNTADLWQGAIHGRAGAVYWLWDKSERAGEGSMYYNSNLTRRADHVAAIGKVNLDLNRLANEITAIQQKPARVAVMYSNYTQVGVEYHVAAMYEAYRYLQNNGEKVFVANDTFPEKINENENLELLIVPVGEYMPQKVWQEIQEFQNRGKKVIFAELNNTYYTECGGAIDATLKSGVLNAATRVSFGGWNASSTQMTGCNSVYAAIGNAIKGFSHNIRVTSGNNATEWTAAEYKDGYVLNLCNYAEESTEISLTLDNAMIVGELFDLTENEKIGDTFTLAPYETKLVWIGAEKATTEFVYSDGSEALTVKNGTITAKLKAKVTAKAEYVHLVAVYSKDGELLKVVSGKGAADESGIISSHVPITVNEGENVADCVIKSFLFNSLSDLKPYLPVETLGQ